MNRALALVLVWGCGDNLAPPEPDAAPPYPAVASTMPKVLTGFGPVMTSVRVVPVFFPGDPLRDALVAGLGRLATSHAWPEAVSEYGAGALSIATPVDVASDPGSFADTAIKPFLLGSLDGTHPEWGPTDPATLATSIYVLFYPATTTLTGMFGTSCQDYAGYHYATSATGAIYAVIPRCRTTLDTLFPVVSHELAEAATDPVLNGWNGVRSLDFAWALALRGSELADLCSYLPDHFQPFDVGTPIARVWSNHAAAAFHDPCAPVPAGQGPFFAAVPDAPDLATQDFGTGDTRVMAGNKVALDASITVPVRLASDAPTPPWTVSAVARDGVGALDFAFDRDTGKNGDVLALTITARARPAGHVASFLLVSELAGRRTQWAGAVEITAP